MHNTILTIGDSNTFGLELPDLPTNAPNEWGNEYFNTKTGRMDVLLPSNLAWPVELGRLRNKSVVNLSLPGASNDRTFRLAVSETVKHKYDLVVCAWTALARYDLIYKDREFPFTANSLWTLNQMPWLNDYLKYHHNEFHMFERLITQVIALQNHFKQINQPYLFVDTGTPFSGNQWFFPKAPTHLESYVKQLDLTYYLGFSEEHFFTWTKHCPPMPHGHLSQEAHKFIANKLHNYLLDIGGAGQ